CSIVTSSVSMVSSLAWLQEDATYCWLLADLLFFTCSALCNCSLPDGFGNTLLPVLFTGLYFTVMSPKVLVSPTFVKLALGVAPDERKDTSSVFSVNNPRDS